MDPPETVNVYGEQPLLVPQWLACRDCEHGLKLTYAAIRSFVQPDGTVQATHEQIAKKIGVSAQQAGRYCRDLCEMRLIETQLRPDGKANLYAFLDHEWRLQTMSLPLPEQSKPDISLRAGRSDPYLSAYCRAFFSAHKVQYRANVADFCQLARWRKYYVNGSGGVVSPEAFVQVARLRWGQGRFGQDALTLRGLCCGWAKIVAATKADMKAMAKASAPDPRDLTREFLQRIGVKDE